MAKTRQYYEDQIAEFETLTRELSISAKGVWISLRMLFAARKDYAFDGPPSALGWLIGCPPDVLLTTLKEYELKPCGFRVEWPPGNAAGNAAVTHGVTRVVWEKAEKAASSLLLTSLRVSKYRESKKESERKSMPEKYEISEIMRDFGLKKGMSNATVTHEFEKFVTHHLETQATDLGWSRKLWQTWVLNWVSWGRNQFIPQGSNGGMKPPPPPPKSDPIARGLWGRQYGDPKQYGYE